ncbi:hypothetical protein HDU85_004109 [Gaertneriomyces sp. JEL0708]|nr:hypothetical protein HDU85_004109 [Gaertneriomyces sp. JEL0708]
MPSLVTDPPAAVPHYAGFVPTLKHQYGQTYGNATRSILQSRRQHKTSKPTKPAHFPKEHRPSTIVRRNPDSRFTFPPVPGYTGYIPRSSEHFGRPYAEGTRKCLNEFDEMRSHANHISPRVQHAVQKREEALRARERNGGVGSNESADGSNTTIKPFLRAPEMHSPIDDISPYSLPPRHERKTFISGYTGFVPRLQEHFGEPYPTTVRHALDEFTLTTHRPSSTYKIVGNASRTTGASTLSGKVVDLSTPLLTVAKKEVTKPIPGFTGHHTKPSPIPPTDISTHGYSGPLKDFTRERPIPGFRGHIPIYIFKGDKPYGISTGECLEEFGRRTGRF